ncbi:MAG: DNA replication/repair protein RecF [Oscillatoriales cyanobacterium]|nr:MAG: DNA replication/repair protein RecF [Oscillatoriales cyanobacterium]
MYLRSIALRHFRNYHEQRVEFHAPKTILVGNNAQGKSNLLESVAFLATLGSPRIRNDRDLVCNGEEAAQIDGEIECLHGRSELQAIVRRSGRRTVRANGETCRRQTDFLGTLNAVEFSCIDIDLVRGTPDYRRRWIDSLIIQLEPIYVYILREYGRILKQRNAVLKQLKPLQSSTNPAIADTLPALDQQLATAGTKVIRRRRRALDRLAPLARHWHHAIGGAAENLTIAYRSQLDPDGMTDRASRPAQADRPTDTDDPHAIQQRFLDRLQQYNSAERARGTTLIGPHRDDIELMIDDRPARHFGSQGQQRTLVLATKLAELQAIETVVGEPPLLLLDDVLAELDLIRQNHLLDVIEDRFQTLITTTHLNAFDAQWLDRSQILTVDRGSILLHTATTLPTYPPHAFSSPS